MGLDYWNWLYNIMKGKASFMGRYTYQCPECKQETLSCYDTPDRSKTICDCSNCGYHSETSLDEIEIEEEPEDD